jgi:hypothetical protein
MTAVTEDRRRVETRRNQRVISWLTADEAEAVRDAARHYDTTVSDLLRRVILDSLFSEEEEVV